MFKSTSILPMKNGIYLELTCHVWSWHFSYTAPCQLSALPFIQHNSSLALYFIHGTVTCLSCPCTTLHCHLSVLSFTQDCTLWPTFLIRFRKTIFSWGHIMIWEAAHERAPSFVLGLIVGEWWHGAECF